MYSQEQIPSLENINIDELTDDQIQSYITRAEASGYTEAQIEMLARARGMSESDISALRSRIEQVRGSSETTGTINRLRENDRQDTFSRYSLSDYNQAGIDPLGPLYLVEDSTLTTSKSKIFGKSFFIRNSFYTEPNLNTAAPEDYLLGPGDELIIDVWGASEKNYSAYISPEGSIFIPDIGPVYLNGLNIKTAEIRLKSRLKSIYSTLDQNTFAQVTLGQLRSININVVGEVERAGTYTLSAFSNVINVLINAGGPTEKGSFRLIQVFRKGRMISKVDLYEFLNGGKDYTSLKLQDQDVILIPPYINRVTIEGEVKRPALYELLDGETLSQALRYAGGFSPEAYRNSISLRRNLENIKTVKSISLDDFDQFPIQAGDHIEVSRIQNQFTKRVRVEGAVNHPGEFEIKDQMTLSQAIKLSEGFRGDAFMKRGVVLREKPNLELEAISFSPQQLVDGTFDLLLQEEDVVQIQSLSALREEYKVFVQGEIQSPGQYPYSAGLTVEDLIFLAGGFKESAARSFVEVARRVDENSQVRGETNLVSKIFSFEINDSLALSKGDKVFTLQPFDLVLIRRSPSYEEQTIIEIEGEVKYPGKYALNKRDERLSEVLARAGGITEFAYPKGATLIRRTEYFSSASNGDVSDKTSIASKIRREELEELFSKDEQVEASSQKFKAQESIGINLSEILANPGGVHDLILQEGDVLSIPKELQTVRVRGEVLYPSTIQYKAAAGLREFISSAGGFTDNALRRKSYVIYPNGSAEKSSSFLGIKNYPSVLPGSEIIIPSKPERRKMTPAELTSIAIGLATLGNLIVTIRNSGG